MLLSWVLACRPPEPGQVDLLEFAGDVPANVLVISVDTLRRDSVGRYAGTADTPFLDGRLERAVVLDDHASCSNWTAPSFHCLYTGARPLELGFVVESGDPEVPGSPRRLDTLPEAFAKAGSWTSLVSSNPWLEPASGWPLGRGFDAVRAEPFATGEVVTELALAAAGELVSPWWFQVHYLDPHEPYDAPEPFRDPAPDIAYDLSDPEEVRRLEGDWFTLSEIDQEAILAWIVAEYRAELRYLDSELERLWSGLDDRGLLDDTLVLWVSDHGQQHLERGRWAHGHHLHQEETGAIAALWASELAPLAWSGRTTHRDLAVTLAVLYGLSLPDATGLALGEAPSDRARTMFHYRLQETGADGVARHSVEADGWRLSYTWDGVLRLHDIATDPTESLDVLEDADDALIDALWDEVEPDFERARELLDHLEPEDPWRG